MYAYISNADIKEGYLLRLEAGEGMFLGNCAVKNQNGKCHFKVHNTNEKDVSLIIRTIEVLEFQTEIVEEKHDSFINRVEENLKTHLVIVINVSFIPL
ncbi:hypothetical protein WN55_02185 [Dufourea novaeangliae]|uniref:Uncharacterized protein n=1 Tax=Dufourea novaeangliae TaxID=178035 RepID=A0A154PH56_DUFNO|nr:hypothetical protein WN55_02185 [Dufourea novaeangliae]